MNAICVNCGGMVSVVPQNGKIFYTPHYIPGGVDSTGFCPEVGEVPRVLLEIERERNERISTEKLSALEVRPGDIVLYKIRDKLSSKVIEFITEALSKTFPDNKILVLDEGAELAVIQKNKRKE